MPAATAQPPSSLVLARDGGWTWGPVVWGRTQNGICDDLYRARMYEPWITSQDFSSFIGQLNLNSEIYIVVFVIDIKSAERTLMLSVKPRKQVTTT